MSNNEIENYESILKTIQNLSSDERKMFLELLKDKFSGKGEMLKNVASTIYDEVPVDVETFIEHPQYLNMKGITSRTIIHALEEADKSNIREIYNVWGKGSGKGHGASIFLARTVYKTLCLKDPQAYYHLAPGSNIFVLNFSINEQQARNVIFNEFVARLNGSPWFKNKFTEFAKEIHFPKEIKAFSGHSGSTSWLGYNTLVGVMDEAEYMKDTNEKTVAEDLYNTLLGSCLTRFPYFYKIMIISSPLDEDGFLWKRLQAVFKDPKAEKFQLGDYREGKTEYIEAFRTEDKVAINAPTWAIRDNQTEAIYNNIKAANPITWKRDFRAVPVGLVEDLGIRESVESIVANSKQLNPVRDVSYSEEMGNNLLSFNVDLFPTFKGGPHSYFMHIDLSEKKDSIGLSLLHFDQSQDKIVVDLLQNVDTKKGKLLYFDSIRQFIYKLSDLGFKIKKITLDSWQSKDTVQQLMAKGYDVQIYSVDKGTEAYDTLIELISGNRVDFYKQDRFLKEILNLRYDGKRYDHPSTGSKDVADAVAAACVQCFKDLMEVKEAPFGGFPRILSGIGLDMVKKTNAEMFSNMMTGESGSMHSMRQAIDPGKSGKVKILSDLDLDNIKRQIDPKFFKQHNQPQKQNNNQIQAPRFPRIIKSR